MLGARRVGVTTALHDLGSRGLISIMRKSIVIKCRPGLEAASEGLYGMAEHEFARLLVPSPAEPGAIASAVKAKP